MTPWTRAYWIAKAVGWENLPRRLLQMARQRSGWLRKRLAPARFSPEAFRAECNLVPEQQPAHWAARAQRFLTLPPQADLKTFDETIWEQQVEQPCHKAIDGHYPFFSAWTGPLGWPPNFNHDPVHDIDWPVGEHWMAFAHSGPPRDDIKLVWEASRLTLAYPLARAFRRSESDTWAQAFWELLDAWQEQNPPQQSAAWACGQEMTFRLMAAVFGAFVTLGHPAATTKRLQALSRLAWQTGRHLDTNINYARSQGNNHALSEAAGLWTIGLLFPEFPNAAAWRGKGLGILAAECKRQIYNDGSYVQHSLNYHRVMMDDLLWVQALARRNNVTLPAVIVDRFGRATDWLLEMIDPDTGRVPNYGSNDGANVLPMSCCDYLDYRPTAQAAACILGRPPAFPPGPWDEKALWLTGQMPSDRGTQQTPTCAKDLSDLPSNPKSAVALPEGGYYILRGPNSWAMTRCHTYRRRPSQADMLHVDLWMDGLNVLRDAGSYAYYHHDPEWMHYFHSTAAHNTLEIDGLDQMTKGPRFLWFHWTRSRVLEFSGDERTGRFVGEHYGYARLPGSPVHRRTIEHTDDHWTIIDEVLGSGEHDVCLRWRMANLDWTPTADGWQAKAPSAGLNLAVDLPEGVSARSVAPEAHPAESPGGAESLYYGRYQRCPLMEIRGTAKAGHRITTTLECSPFPETEA
jgi:hypothetical protein